MGNISGTGAGMNLVFGIDWKLGALIMIAVMIYCYFSKGVYSKVEKGITICIVAMIIAFISHWWERGARLESQRGRINALDLSCGEFSHRAGLYQYQCLPDDRDLRYLPWQRENGKKMISLMA